MLWSLLRLFRIDRVLSRMPIQSCVLHAVMLLLFSFSALVVAYWP